MDAITGKINRAVTRALIRTQAAALTAKRKLHERDGSFFTEHGLSIVITVVIAAIVITAVVALFKNEIFPQLDNKVNDFFAIS